MYGETEWTLGVARQPGWRVRGRNLGAAFRLHLHRCGANTRSYTGVFSRRYASRRRISDSLIEGHEHPDIASRDHGKLPAHVPSLASGQLSSAAFDAMPEVDVATMS
ncbi:hypothetical protein PSPO01_08016 [Paraphaeosphaeria sporulosa]